MKEKIEKLSDTDLRCLVWAYDALALPLSARRGNDDEALRTFLEKECGMEDNLINMHMIMLLVFRECVVRGLMVQVYQ